MNVASVAVPTVAHAPISTSGLAEKVSIRNLDFYYGTSKALKALSLPLYENKVTAFIGPSGCSTKSCRGRSWMAGSRPRSAAPRYGKR